jgi:hypothetical protein
MPLTIPPTLAPFFQEYDLTHLRIQQDSGTIIERTLRFGTRSELRWLFATYSLEEVSRWVRQWGQFGLPEPHLTFWRLVLDLEDDPRCVNGIGAPFRRKCARS